MRLEEVLLITTIDSSADADGFDTQPVDIATEISATEMSVKISDKITGEHEGWHVDIKLAVDIDDYETAIIGPGSPILVDYPNVVVTKRIRPQKLIYNTVPYLIKDPVKNLKTHQYELLCTEVE
jgi:hypothetical protein